MKKLLVLFTITALFSSCNKNKCYIISDCIGNDIQKYCGSEQEIRDFCTANSSPGCTWNYREE